MFAVDMRTQCCIIMFWNIYLRLRLASPQSNVRSFHDFTFHGIFILLIHITLYIIMLRISSTFNWILIRPTSRSFCLSDWPFFFFTCCHAGLGAWLFVCAKLQNAWRYLVVFHWTLNKKHKHSLLTGMVAISNR